MRLLTFTPSCKCIPSSAVHGGVATEADHQQMFGHTWFGVQNVLNCALLLVDDDQEYAT
jgi:hypothetical protein